MSKLHLRAHIKKRLQGEDFCYACGLNGTLIECEICPKAYHEVCLGDSYFADNDFFRCPWHFCDVCNTNNVEFVDQISVVCTKCPKSYCPSCVPAEVKQRLCDCEASQPTQALYDSNSYKIEKFMHFHHKGGADVDAARWCAGMLPPGSMAFVCKECEVETLRNTDASLSKELYQVSLPGAKLDRKRENIRNKTRNWVAPEQVALTSSNKEMFSRHIEAINVKGGHKGNGMEVIVLRRWSSAHEAAKDLEFSGAAILASADSYQSWRDEKEDSVVTGCNLVWSYREDQAIGPDFSGSMHYPGVEVRLQTQAHEELSNSRPLCQFTCIQEAIRIMTIKHQDIYTTAKINKKGEIKRGFTFRFCDDPDIMSHTESGKKGPANDGIELWKRKKVRDSFVLQSLKLHAKNHAVEKKKLEEKKGLVAQQGTPDSNHPDDFGTECITDLTTGTCGKKEQESDEQFGQRNDMVHSASTGTIVGTKASHSPRNVNSRESGQHGPCSPRMFLSSPGQNVDSISQRSVLALETIFKTRKTPVVGEAYQVDPSLIPLPENLPSVSDEGLKVWDPMSDHNPTQNDLEILRRAQFLPGLIVKIYPRSPHECDETRVVDCDINPVIGMVLCTPIGNTNDIRIAVYSSKTCTVPLKMLQIILHEDDLVGIYYRCKCSIVEAERQVKTFIKEHIKSQWSAKQICNLLQSFDRSKDNLKKAHKLISANNNGQVSVMAMGMKGHDSGSYSEKFRESASRHNYATRKLNITFCTSMKSVVDKYYSLHPIQDCYGPGGDLDDGGCPTVEEVAHIKDQIITVHMIADDFLAASHLSHIKIEKATDEKGENVEISITEPEPEPAGFNNEREMEFNSSYELKAARPEDLRCAGFDLKPLPLPEVQHFKRKREQM